MGYLSAWFCNEHEEHSDGSTCPVCLADKVRELEAWKAEADQALGEWARVAQMVPPKIGYPLWEQVEVFIREQQK